jgi:hypothetical protein
MSFVRSSRVHILIAGALLSFASAARAQTVTPVLLNGPDAEKKVVVVIGDGYKDTEQATWATWVKTNVVDGMFGTDEYFRANHTAFNIYRIDLASAESGVSIKRYTADSCKTSEDTDDVADTTCTATSTKPCYTHDTALDFVFTNCWGRCWMEGSSNTSSQLKTILDQLVPKRDYVLRVLNVLTGEGGGCGGGGSLTVTRGENWQTIAHEFGHMISGLYDEYTASAYASTKYSGTVNTRNCSTDLSTNVVWNGLMTPGISVPPATVYDAMTMDIDDTVGMFEGCKTYGKGIYRPVQNCRMRSENSGQFCPVCVQTMNATLSGFPDSNADFMYYANIPGAECRGTGASYTSGANVTNTGTSSSTVLCPARRIQDSAGNFSNTLFGEVFVIDRSSTADVCCQMFARTPNGNTEYGSTACSTGSSTADQRVKLDLPKVRNPYTFAHFAMKCTLPPASGGAASSVATYRIVQQRY